MKPLAERMKEYEFVETKQQFIPRSPVYARLDGRAFHTFCRGLDKPFDENLIQIMQDTTKFLVEETCATIGYVQSDEISLAWVAPPDKVMFDGKKQKLVSVLAGLCSSKFTQLCFTIGKDIIKEKASKKIPPAFDCRVINMPSEQELANMLLWRELDAYKNSVSMLAQAHFSAKELHGKTTEQRQEMLFTYKGINFNDMPAHKKRGAYFKRRVVELPVTQEMVDKSKGNISLGNTVTRTRIEEVDLPRMHRVANKSFVYFYDEPVVFLPK